jgi:hypothetical protein
MAGGGQKAKRPSAIRWFERLYLLSLLVSALGVLVVFSRLTGLSARDHAGATLVAAITLCLYVALVLLVSRRRNRVAKWLVVALTAATAIFWLFFAVWANAAHTLDWPGLVQHLLQIAAVALLFTAPARAWLEKSEDAA